jgi:hypothetical protein
MSGINWSRVLLGGLAAGLILNAGRYLVNGMLLREKWAAAVKDAPTDLASSVQIAVVGFLAGIFTVWLYAAIRPRYGAGPKTAVLAGTAVWVLGYLLAWGTPMAMHLLPADLVLIGIAAGLVNVIVAALAGACVYNEPA